jgi:hypothetical protein
MKRETTRGKAKELKKKIIENPIAQATHILMF